MIKKSLWEDEGTGEVFDRFPDGAVAVNGPYKKKEGIGVDLKDLLMSGGSGLLAYTMADQVFGDDVGEKKKRNAFDRLLSKIIPIGIGGLGAYVGHRFAKGMDGKNAQGVKSASENTDKTAKQPAPKRKVQYSVDAGSYGDQNFGLPTLKVAKPPIKLEGDKPYDYDKYGRPYLKDDWWSQNMHDYYKDAMIMSRKTKRPIGECLEEMERDAKTAALYNYLSSIGIGGVSGISWLHGGKLQRMVDALDAQQKVQNSATAAIRNTPVPLPNTHNEQAANVYSARTTPLTATESTAANAASEIRKDLKYRNPRPYRIGGLVGAGLTAADLLWGLWNSYKGGRISTSRGYLTGDGRDAVIPTVE